MQRETSNLSLWANVPRKAAGTLQIALALAAGLAGGILGLPPACATPLTVTDPFLQWYNVGPNNLHFAAGQLVRYGATSVTPNGDGGTTGTATTTNVATGSTINRSMGFFPSPAVPNFFRARYCCVANPGLRHVLPGATTTRPT